MKQGKIHFFQLTFILSVLFASTTAFAGEAKGIVDILGNLFIYLVLLSILFGFFLVIVIIKNVLSNSNWSLADAISEECEVTAMSSSDANGLSSPILNAEGQPFLITELRASTSRVVALMGMIVILLLFVGFGIIALYLFATTGKMPEQIDKVVNFLVTGLTLFAPYMVNKFSNIFEVLSPKKL